MERLLTVDEAAERLGTSTRFIRRLIAERRIAYTKLGRHVRIATRDLDAFVASGGSIPARWLGDADGAHPAAGPHGRVTYRVRYRDPDGRERSRCSPRRATLNSS